MTRPRLGVEREVLARLLGAPDLGVLRRWLLGLHLLGVGERYFVGEHRRAFLALGALAGRGERVDVESVSRESGGRVDPDYLTWLCVAYSDGDASLYALALSLLDADRRARADSVARVLINAVGAPAADVDRAIGTAIGALRRVGRDAA